MFPVKACRYYHIDLLTYAISYRLNMLSGWFGLAPSFQPFKLFACVQFFFFFFNITHKGTIILLPSFNKKIIQTQTNHSKSICKMRIKIILIKQIVRCFTSTTVHIPLHIETVQFFSPRQISGS